MPNVVMARRSVGRDARLINDRGEIVCTGVLANGDLHAVLLIPVEDDDANADHGAVATTPSISPHYVPRGTERRLVSQRKGR
jgi:hypothetical protein